MSGRNARQPRKLVETSVDLDDHAPDDKFGETAVGEAMDAGAEALLNGPDGQFDLTDVSVGCNNVEMCGRKIMSDTCKLMITVDVTHNKTASGVQFDDCPELKKNGFV